ncbi:MAG: acyl-CoA dehydratase activase [Candidatus Stygibacter australis]|nr:acyl-CoA dehydratase activase [Candidatus Stygibacter australis]MDP8320802.1 acyl-CoA dehydratase activase [Candidatus Stygibacter australis]
MRGCGIDSGSRTTKLVFLENNQIIWDDVQPTGLSPVRTAESMLEKAKREIPAELVDALSIVVTGYGRNLILQNRRKISEITCHARGVNYYFPDCKLVIDIGGQDSKGILLENGGKVTDFVMNDRCAAGTGRFLEKVANILEVEVSELGDLAEQSERELEITNTCVVFAESEMIGMISRGEKRSDIAQAVHRSIARRIANMVAGFPKEQEAVFTGGVALNKAMVKCLEEEIETKIKVTDNPFLTGALGAALFAQEYDEKK